MVMDCARYHLLCSYDYNLNDNYHPYGIGVFGFDPLNRTYERDIALIESIIVLAIMLIVQSVAKLLTRLIKRKRRVVKENHN